MLVHLPFNVPGAVGKMWPVWSELDRCHLDNDLQSGSAKLREKTLFHLWLVIDILENRLWLNWFPNSYPLGFNKSLLTIIEFRVVISPTITFEGLVVYFRICALPGLGRFPV